VHIMEARWVASVLELVDAVDVGFHRGGHDVCVGVELTINLI